MSYPTLHEIRTAADEYWALWEQLLADAPDLRHAIGQHSPSAFGWKVEGDLAPLEAAEHLYELGDSIHMGPVNGERAILTIRKPQALALDTLQDIKVLQRRPSKPGDRLGPDSLDFFAPHGLPEIDALQKALRGHAVSLEKQHNESTDWLTLIYRDHEFKIKDHHVWEICVQEASQLLD